MKAPHGSIWSRNRHGYEGTSGLLRDPGAEVGAPGGGVAHGDGAPGRLAIERSWSVSSSRQTETDTLRTGPSDFSREPIVPGWI